jgi:hypothetical protein
MSKIGQPDQRLSLTGAEKWDRGHLELLDRTVDDGYAAEAVPQM